MDYLLGIDIGTSGAKTILMSMEGEILDIVVNDYDINSPKENWAEEDPDDWWNAIKKCLKKSKKSFKNEMKKIAAIGLSGQMHGAVFVDENGKPLYPCIVWADNRAVEECKIIEEKIGKNNIQNITGNPVIPTYTAPKILWFKKNHKNLYKKTHKILMAKDYIGYKLTSNFFTDYSDASGTLLFDIHEKRWSEEIFDKINLDMNKHPQIFNSSDIVGLLNKKAAQQLGLKKDIPVVAGGGDLACGALGNANLWEGTASITIGTAGQVVASVNEVYQNSIGKIFNFCHVVKDKYFVLASILSAGLCLKWFKNNITLIENLVTEKTSMNSFDLLLEGIEEVPPGVNGLMFLPYLNGAGTPYMNEKAKGVFIGLTANHSKKDMVRSILEGVTFGIRECLETLNDVGLSIDNIIISAGGSKNEKWRQIQANIYNNPVATLKTTDTSPFGAAILASIAQGKFKNINEAAKYYVEQKEIVRPNKEHTKIYNKIYNNYKGIYPALKDYFNKTY